MRCFHEGGRSFMSSWRFPCPTNSVIKNTLFGSRQAPKNNTIFGCRKSLNRNNKIKQLVNNLNPITQKRKKREGHYKSPHHVYFSFKVLNRLLALVQELFNCYIDAPPNPLFVPIKKRENRLVTARQKQWKMGKQFSFYPLNTAPKPPWPSFCPVRVTSRDFISHFFFSMSFCVGFV